MGLFSIAQSRELSIQPEWVRLKWNQYIMKKIMFVCLGNICRSPAAEAILRHLLEKEGLKTTIEAESSGIGDWHIGHLPDERMRAAAKDRGYALNSRAKLFDKTYFDEFDYILAADHEIMEHLHRFAETPEHKAKIHLITAFGKSFRNQVIPDPYFGGESGFDHILDILEDACIGLLNHLKTNSPNNK